MDVRPKWHTTDGSFPNAMTAPLANEICCCVATLAIKIIANVALPPPGNDRQTIDHNILRGRSPRKDCKVSSSSYLYLSYKHSWKSSPNFDNLFSLCSFFFIQWKFNRESSIVAIINISPRALEYFIIIKLHCSTENDFFQTLNIYKQQISF